MLEVFNKSIIYNKENEIRESADNLRLTIELLLKNILKKNKSIDNQKDILNKKLKESGVNQDSINLFTQTLKCYTKYQNECVKHSNKIENKDLEFITELGLIIIKYISKNLGEKHG